MASNLHLADPPRLRLRPDIGAGAPVVVPPLARLMGLDKWGRSLLTTAGARGMSTAAAALLIVFVFEASAWMLLFNVIANGATWGLGRGTPLAVLLGLLFASAVFLFERGLMVADTTTRDVRAWGGFIGRLGLVALSAYVTAHPLELFLFHQEIQERLMEEGKREVAVHHVRGDAREAAPMDFRREAEANLKGSPIELAVATAREALDDARQEGLTSTGTAARGKGQLEAAQQRLTTLRARRDKAGRDVTATSDPVIQETIRDDWTRLNREIAAAERNLDRAQADDTNVRGEHAAVHEQIEQLEGDVERASAAYEKAVAKAEDDLRTKAIAAGDRSERIDAWYRRVRDARPGEVVEAPNDSLSAFDPYTAGFVHRTQILADLRDARPPQWPTVDDATLADAGAFLGVDPALEARPSARDLERATTFNRIYWLAFGVACFVPIISVLTKLTLLGRELKAYYSISAQAQAGNGEARRILETLATLSASEAPRAIRDEGAA